MIRERDENKQGRSERGTSLISCRSLFLTTKQTFDVFNLITFRILENVHVCKLEEETN